MRVEGAEDSNITGGSIMQKRKSVKKKFQVARDSGHSVMN